MNTKLWSWPHYSKRRTKDTIVYIINPGNKKAESKWKIAVGPTRIFTRVSNVGQEGLDAASAVADVNNSCKRSFKQRARNCRLGVMRCGKTT